MGLFSKNPNEVNYVGGKKHWTDVIKNSGPAELLVWRQPEEDFNTNSTLIVFPSEEALFYKGGVVEQAFEEGTYKLSTENYPFISRIRNAFSGGISVFNCVVYFVRKAHSMEILWGTDSPIQVRDPVYGMATSIKARGSYKVQINNGAKFLAKLLGNNIESTTQDELNLYFRNEFMQYVKSTIAREIKESNQEILGIAAEQDVLAKKVQARMQDVLEDYGLRLVNFVIAALDIHDSDPERKTIDHAYARKREAEILGTDYNRVVSRELLTDVAKNPGAGGLASAGAGLGLGLGALPLMGDLMQQVTAPSQAGSAPVPPAPNGAGPSGSAGACPACNAPLAAGAKFCGQCGAKAAPRPAFCTECGAAQPAGVKFCPECGAKSA